MTPDQEVSVEEAKIEGKEEAEPAEEEDDIKDDWAASSGEEEEDEEEEEEEKSTEDKSTYDHNDLYCFWNNKWLGFKSSKI